MSKKYQELKSTCNDLIQAIENSTTDMWHDDLELTSEVVVVDNDEKVYDYNNETEKYDCNTYPGIRKELEKLKKLIKYEEIINNPSNVNNVNGNSTR